MSTKSIDTDSVIIKDDLSLFNFSFQFYPPIKKFYDFNRQYEIYNTEKNIPKFLNNGMKEEIKSDEEDDIYTINRDFFESLLGKNNTCLNKDKKIKTISKIIRKSKLMEKLEKESKNSNKKNDLEVLSTLCAKNLLFMELKKGKILFKVGDNGDRFYFILSGKITILKPRQIHVKMSLQEYITYLYLLIKEKEDFLFNQVVLNNCAQIPITSVEEIKSLYKIVFVMNLKLYLERGTIDNNRNLRLFFDKNYQTFNEYNLDIVDLELLEHKKQKAAGNKKWINYILNNCNLTNSDLRVLGRYNGYDGKKNILCYVYDSFLYLGPGFFFGDSALEEKNTKRNASIRAEEDSVLGFLKIVDYSNIIAPQRKIEKMKQINFLINNFFLKI
jgi:CRP-like cAMP-binding protein